MWYSVVLCLSLALQTCMAYEGAVRNVRDRRSAVDLENILRKHSPSKQVPGDRLLGFSWQDCGSSSAAVEVLALSVSPDVLRFPETINVTANVNIRKQFGAPLKADITLKKKVFGVYIEIPCVDNVGSCTYDDLCSMLAPLRAQCPAQLKKLGINCNCPFKQTSIDIKGASFSLPSMSVPGGDYTVEAHVTQNGAEVVCMSVSFSIA